MMLEPKFVDAVPWPNRVSIAMAANSDWVVPASKDERRYVVFNVANTYARGQCDDETRKAYFKALRVEMYKNGGVEAMLYDLLHMDLRDWHPREIIETDALLEQKALSLKPIENAWVKLLDTGELPSDKYNAPNEAPSDALLEFSRAESKRGGIDITSKKLGDFLRERGCTSTRTKEIVKENRAYGVLTSTTTQRARAKKEKVISFL